MRLAGKVAIVTGGSRGIGRAIALAFAREGAMIAVVSRNEISCDKVVTEISQGGGNAIRIRADIASEEDMARMAEQTKDFKLPAAPEAGQGVHRPPEVLPDAGRAGSRAGSRSR